MTYFRRRFARHSPRKGFSTISSRSCFSSSSGTTQRKAPLSDLALNRGINVVQFVASSQDDAFVSKRYTTETKRMHPRSLSDDSWRRVRDLTWDAQHEAEVDEELRARYFELEPPCAAAAGVDA